MSQEKNRELTLLATAGILAALAAVDYYTPDALYTPPARGDRIEWLAFGAVGICIAQVTLIAAWAVFAPGNIVVRLPWSLLLGLMMWYVLVFGERRVNALSPYGHYGPQDVRVLGIVLLVGVTVLQIPLWIAKLVFRYRMLMPGEVAEPAQRKPLQFQVKHLLIGTFLFAVALSPIRLVLRKETVGSLMSNREFGHMSVMMLAAIVVNLVATLPCLWGGFASAKRVWRLGVAWSVYNLGVTGTEVAVLRAFGPPHEPETLWEILWVLGVVNFTQGVVVFAVMRIYRTLGYRLQRVPRAG